ncbi:MAG: outer membrane lipoprotein-sorting protein [Deltaproteobacteria bacterium]|nr:outer membrane lipoprotein-sorting protein [Deltaproteobacteria bacterium]
MNLAHPVLASLLAAAALAGAGAAHAATPEEDGAAVARELVRHRTGFGDQAVTVTMELRNAGGEAARKEIRVKTLERQGDAPATVVILEAPSDVKGTALLSLGDDQWLYLPASHRVRRIASSNRSGPFLGSEFSYEDLMGDKPDRYRWRLTGKKACPAGGDCLVVETTPTYEGSGYSRRVLWVEAGTYRVMQVDYFDVKGDALKTLVYAGYQTYAGGHDRARTLTMTNHVTGKSTVLRFGDYAFGNGFTEADFNKERLAQAR